MAFNLGFGPDLDSGLKNDGEAKVFADIFSSTLLDFCYKILYSRKTHQVQVSYIKC